MLVCFIIWRVMKHLNFKLMKLAGTLVSVGHWSLYSHTHWPSQTYPQPGSFVEPPLLGGWQYVGTVFFLFILYLCVKGTGTRHAVKSGLGTMCHWDILVFTANGSSLFIKTQAGLACSNTLPPSMWVLLFNRSSLEFLQLLAKAAPPPSLQDLTVGQTLPHHRAPDLLFPSRHCWGPSELPLSFDWMHVYIGF